MATLLYSNAATQRLGAARAEDAEHAKVSLKKLEEKAKHLCGVNTSKRGRPTKEQKEKRATAKFCAARCFALEGDFDALKVIVDEVKHQQQVVDATAGVGAGVGAGAGAGAGGDARDAADGLPQDDRVLYTEVELAMALSHYEAFHRIEVGSATVEQLQRSSAKIGGWLAAAAGAQSGAGGGTEKVKAAGHYCCWWLRRHPPAAAADPHLPAPTPSLSPAPAPAGRGKQVILVRVEGNKAMDGSTVESLLGHLIRDGGISRLREDVVAKHGESAYYLRPKRPPVENAQGHLHADEVDHTFECQMAGHAIFQTREFHPLLKELTLSDASSSMRLNGQPIVVQNALRDIKALQNCTNDDTLFNLKLLSKSLNITKGHVIAHWLDSRRAAIAAPHLNRVDLCDAFRRSAACTRGDIEQDEADALAAVLQRQLINVEETYIERLGLLEEAAGQANQDQKRLGARLRALQQTIGSLLEEHEGE
jgi:hypothetical protein